MLEVGDTIALQNAPNPCVVTGSLGEGSQGRVYAVDVELAGGTHRYALKWFKPGYDTPAQRLVLDALIERGIPSDRFLWPIDLASSATESGFGYLMPLRPDSFSPLSDLCNGQVDLAIATVATVGMEIAESFLVLHSAGLCYRDINLGNVFFDPATGTALICDTDNVGIDGASTSEIAGSPFFSAPEVVRGEALPSTATDRYSLAVLLFLLLILHHPLEGRHTLDYEVFDQAADLALFGTDPRFIFDPSDPSNRPVPGLHDNATEFWPRFPPFLRRLFITAFTDGLMHPGARVTESIWRKALARLRDAIVVCRDCEVESFYDEESGTAECWRCGHEIPLPPRFEVASTDPVFLVPGVVVTAHHVERNFDFRTRIAEVVTHPEDPTLVGLRNLTQTAWTARVASGAPSVIDPERAVAIVDGLVIELSPGRVAHLTSSSSGLDARPD